MAAATLHRLALIGGAVVGISLMAPALGQDQMVLGPRQYENDARGAVLCIWRLYLGIQGQTAACALPRRAVDDVLDHAIADIEEFILANSSLHPSRAALDSFKLKATVLSRDSVNRDPKACKGDFLAYVRGIAPEQIQSSVKELLAVPREPVMNPCL